MVTGAVQHAERAGASEADVDHVLLALLDQSGGRGARCARERRDSIARALAEARRHCGLTRAEADALAGLGIDLASVVSRVEEAHGVGAMATGTGRERRERGG